MRVRANIWRLFAIFVSLVLVVGLMPPPALGDVGGVSSPFERASTHEEKSVSGSGAVSGGILSEKSLRFAKTLLEDAAAKKSDGTIQDLAGRAKAGDVSIEPGVEASARKREEAAREAAQAAQAAFDEEDARLDISSLDDGPFATQRIVVALEQGAELNDRDENNVVSSGGGIHILQYKSVDAAKRAYVRYQEASGVVFVAPDSAISQAEGADGAGAGDADAMDAADAVEPGLAIPVADLSVLESDQPVLEGAEQVGGVPGESSVGTEPLSIALIDSAVPADFVEHYNDEHGTAFTLAGRTSVISGEQGDEVSRDSHGARMLEDILDAHVKAADAKRAHDADLADAPSVDAPVGASVRILSIEAIDDAGYGSAASVYAALALAAAAKCDIVNMSFAGRDVTGNDAIAVGVDRLAAAAQADGRSVALLASAGNWNEDVGSFVPASCEHVQGVGALDAALVDAAAEGSLSGSRAGLGAFRTPDSNYGKDLVWAVAESTSHAAAVAAGALSAMRDDLATGSWAESLQEALIDMHAREKGAPGVSETDSGDTPALGQPETTDPIEGNSTTAGADGGEGVVESIYDTIADSVGVTKRNPVADSIDVIRLRGVEAGVFAQGTAPQGSVDGIYFHLREVLGHAGETLSLGYVTGAGLQTSIGGQTTGLVQTVPVAASGVYSFTVKGAAGSSAEASIAYGGNGGLVKAGYEVDMTETPRFYVGVGSSGVRASYGTSAGAGAGGWNGGGYSHVNAGNEFNTQIAAGAGGATYVALGERAITTYGGQLRDYTKEAGVASDDLLLVAGGGGGSAYVHRNSDGANWYGGGGNGGGGVSSTEGGVNGRIAGNAAGPGNGGNNTSGHNGYFLYGKDRGDAHGAGGGGGYYGGYAGTGGTGGAGGGSGFYRDDHIGSVTVSVGGGGQRKTGGTYLGENGSVEITLRAVTHAVHESGAAEGAATTVYVDSAGGLYTDNALTSAYALPGPKDGVPFAGLFTAPGGAGLCMVTASGDTGALASASGNLDLYPHWSDEGSYAIDFTAGTGLSGSMTSIAEYPLSASYEIPSLDAFVATDSGKMPRGWRVRWAAGGTTSYSDVLFPGDVVRRLAAGDSVTPASGWVVVRDGVAEPVGWYASDGSALGGSGRVTLEATAADIELDADSPTVAAQGVVGPAGADSVCEVDLPYAGYYRLEVTGGGGANGAGTGSDNTSVTENAPGAEGGTAFATVVLDPTTTPTLYLVPGGRGSNGYDASRTTVMDTQDTAGGYNGGGSGKAYYFSNAAPGWRVSGGGGGASHIATGLGDAGAFDRYALSSYASGNAATDAALKAQVLLVAGGGAGGASANHTKGTTGQHNRMGLSGAGGGSLALDASHGVYIGNGVAGRTDHAGYGYESGGGTYVGGIAGLKGSDSRVVSGAAGLFGRGAAGVAATSTTAYQVGTSGGAGGGWGGGGSGYLYTNPNSGDGNWAPVGGSAGGSAYAALSCAASPLMHVGGSIGNFEVEGNPPYELGQDASTFAQTPAGSASVTFLGIHLNLSADDADVAGAAELFIGPSGALYADDLFAAPVAFTAPTRVGYRFDGYRTAPYGGGVKYLNADGTLSGVAIDGTVANDSTLYASWVQTGYSIEFNLGEGMAGSVPEDYVSQTVRDPYIVPPVEGIYTDVFDETVVGWRVKWSDGSGEGHSGVLYGGDVVRPLAPSDDIESSSGWVVEHNGVVSAVEWLADDGTVVGVGKTVTLEPVATSIVIDSETTSVAATGVEGADGAKSVVKVGLTYAGYYRLEATGGGGAKGAGTPESSQTRNAPGAEGGTAYGTVVLDPATTPSLYLVPGGKGSNAYSTSGYATDVGVPTQGGYNGGGSGWAFYHAAESAGWRVSGGGGGASHIATGPGNAAAADRMALASYASSDASADAALKAQVLLVAGGGAGGGSSNGGSASRVVGNHPQEGYAGGGGGALTMNTAKGVYVGPGKDGMYKYSQTQEGKGGTYDGGAGGAVTGSNSVVGLAGSFGKGANAPLHGKLSNAKVGVPGGAGGGWGGGGSGASFSNSTVGTASDNWAPQGGSGGGSAYLVGSATHVGGTVGNASSLEPGRAYYAMNAASSSFAETSPGSASATFLGIRVALDDQGATTAGTAELFVSPTGGLHDTDAFSTFASYAAPTRTGYVLDGFYTEPHGGGTKYLNADGTLAGEAIDGTVAHDGTVYAHWIQTGYTVAFTLGAGMSGDVPDDYASITASDAFTVPSIDAFQSSATDKWITGWRVQWVAGGGVSRSGMLYPGDVVRPQGAGDAVDSTSGWVVEHAGEVAAVDWRASDGSAVAVGKTIVLEAWEEDIVLNPEHTAVTATGVVGDDGRGSVRVARLEHAGYYRLAAAGGGGANGAGTGAYTENAPGAEGGTASGTVVLDPSTTPKLYLVPGGRGSNAYTETTTAYSYEATAGGYNGGGRGWAYYATNDSNAVGYRVAGGGGGASHIATSLGAEGAADRYVLSSYAVSDALKANILLVAGGGAGGASANHGTAKGSTSGGGTSSSWVRMGYAGAGGGAPVYDSARGVYVGNGTVGSNTCDSYSPNQGAASYGPGTGSSVGAASHMIKGADGSFGQGADGVYGLSVFSNSTRYMVGSSGGAGGGWGGGGSGATYMNASTVTNATGNWSPQGGSGGGSAYIVGSALNVGGLRGNDATGGQATYSYTYSYKKPIDDYYPPTSPGSASVTFLGIHVQLDDQGATAAGIDEIYVSPAGGFYTDDTFATVAAFTAPQRAGYVLNGFYTQPGGAGMKYLNADGTLAGAAIDGTVVNDGVVYASWTQVGYTVTYELGAGTSGDVPDDVATESLTTAFTAFDVSGLSPSAIDKTVAGWRVKWTHEGSTMRSRIIYSGDTVRPRVPSDTVGAAGDWVVEHASSVFDVEWLASDGSDVAVGSTVVLEAVEIDSVIDSDNVSVGASGVVGADGSSAVRSTRLAYEGYYRLEAEGGGGGNGMGSGANVENAPGAEGGFVAGTFVLDADTRLYLVPGGKGLAGEDNVNAAAKPGYYYGAYANGTLAGGYNGGGAGVSTAGVDGQVDISGAGGGASHIATGIGATGAADRYVLSSYASGDSTVDAALKAQVLLVAGGGAGGGSSDNGASAFTSSNHPIVGYSGGGGGSLPARAASTLPFIGNGADGSNAGKNNSAYTLKGYGGTSVGGAVTNTSYSRSQPGLAGLFGRGGDAAFVTVHENPPRAAVSGGAGGGWYGGSSGGAYADQGNVTTSWSPVGGSGGGSAYLKSTALNATGSYSSALNATYHWKTYTWEQRYAYPGETSAGSASATLLGIRVVLNDQNDDANPTRRARYISPDGSMSSSDAFSRDVAFQVPSYNGLSFRGYFTEPFGRGVKYIDENGRFVNGAINGDVPNGTELYACWIDYSITYSAGTSGIASGDDVVRYASTAGRGFLASAEEAASWFDVTPGWELESWQVHTGSDMVVETLGPGDIVKQSADGTTWVKSSDGGATWSSSPVQWLGDDGLEVTADSNVTVSATWRKKTFTILAGLECLSDENGNSPSSGLPYEHMLGRLAPDAAGATFMYGPTGEGRAYRHDGAWYADAGHSTRIYYDEATGSFYGDAGHAALLGKAYVVLTSTASWDTVGLATNVNDLPSSNEAIEQAGLSVPDGATRIAGWSFADGGVSIPGNAAINNATVTFTYQSISWPTANATYGPNALADGVVVVNPIWASNEVHLPNAGFSRTIRAGLLGMALVIAGLLLLLSGKGRAKRRRDESARRRV